MPAASSIRGLVIMGVAGSGKSCVGEAVVARTGGRLIEGDSFHPPSNIKKMSAGVPLDDHDRDGWLDRLCHEIRTCLQAGERPVLACSALKRQYREKLRSATPSLGFVFLELTPAEASLRIAKRTGHYMPASLADSQFAALQPPYGENLVLSLDASLPVSILAARVEDWMASLEAEAS